MNQTNPVLNHFETAAAQWKHFGESACDAAIAKAYLRPQMTVAAVGAGASFMATGLAARVRKVHLFDSSEDLLAVARKNLAQFPNVKFHLTDGIALPLPNASVDGVFAAIYLHDCPDPLSAIREMTRILRPGGRIILTDKWMRAEESDQRLGFERSQIRAWLEEAGLVNLIVDGAGETSQLDGEVGAGEQAGASIFLAAGTKRIAARDSVQASYSVRALSGGNCGCDSDSGCCSPGVILLNAISSVHWDGGYSAHDTSNVPAEAAGFSLGCGNPLAMATLQAGETVLDIGSGGGLDAFIAAQRVGKTGQVIGVDMTPAMLQRARRAAKKGGFENVEFKHGYAEKLPVAENSVDIIISNCVINLTEDKGKVFREAFRVLKTGGRLEVNDMVFASGILPAARTSAIGWAGCVSGALPEAEYLDLVKQAGFQDVRARRSSSSGTSQGIPVYSVQVSARK